MRISSFAPLIVVGVLVLQSGRASATSYFVAPTGDDTAAGTSAAPWKTLQKAASKVMAGDTVTARDGSYAGFACEGKHGTADARIVFKSENKGGAKISSAGMGASGEDYVQLTSCSYLTVDGFEVSGAPRSGIAILGNSEDGSDARDVIIQNNVSHHNGGMKIAGRHDGIFSGFALNLTIQDNEVHDNAEHGIYVSNAADNPIIRRNHVYVTGTNCVQINADLSTGGDGLISGWLIEGNVVHNCGSAAFNLDGAVKGVMQNNLAYDCAKGGITLFQGDGAQASNDNLIVNNTIFNPTGSRSALQVAAKANNNVVFNNILISKAAGLEIQTVTGLVHDYNFVSSYDGGSASAHEAMVDPAMLFADVAGRKLGLGAGSMALDAGIAMLGGKSAPTVDIEGKTRPAGAAPDRGCFEGGSTGVVVVPTTDGGATTAPDGGARDATTTGAAGTNGGGNGTTGGAGTNATTAGTAGSSPGTSSTGAAGTGSSPTGAAGTSSSTAGTSGGGSARQGGSGCSIGRGQDGFASLGLGLGLLGLVLARARRRAR